MDYWKNKACLLTGGTSGLGLALARSLARQGAKIAINGRDPKRLAAAASHLRSQGGEVITLAGDVTEKGLAKQLVAEVIDSLGPLDLACHAAGRSMRSELLATTGEEFEALWRINTRAAFDLAQAAADPLAANQGHLVLIGSLASRVAPKYLGAYPASKFPLAAIAQQLRLERGPSGLHTLLVCPGPIRRQHASEQSDASETEDRYRSETRGVPPSAAQPGGGAKVRALDPDRLAEKILQACVRRQPELVVPGKSRLLFILSQLSPRLGDWLLQKMT